MTTTWILVAHRSGARLFENKGPGKGLKSVMEIPHPEGRLKNREINADKPGRSFNSMGHARHAMSREQEPTEHLAEQFAKHLASVLDEGRKQNRCARLILVAEPRFLGNLNSALNPLTAALVTATVDKDLALTEDRDIPGFLSDVIRL